MRSFQSQHTLSLSRLVIAALLLLIPAALCLKPVNSGFSPPRLSSYELESKMRDAFAVLAEERQRRGLGIDDTLDPNRTGLIGMELSEMTTTYGRLEAKRTATQPAWASIMAHWLEEQHVGPGDPVAIAGSGSFPGLVLAAHLACESIGARPLSCLSLTASMYGANDPEWTLLDQFSVLRKERIVHSLPVAFSLGGENDQATSLPPELRQRLISEAMKLQSDLSQFFPKDPKTNLILESDLNAAIEKKWNLLIGYKPKAFINIGGSQTSLGACPHSTYIPAGDLRGWQPCSCPNRGLIARFAAADVPTFHFLNIEKLCLKYGLPWDPVPFPEGELNGKTPAWWQRSAIILLVLGVWSWLGYSGMRK